MKIDENRILTRVERKEESYKLNQPLSDMSAESLLPKTIVTSRERDVLYLIAEGFTTQEIANVLYVSTETVKSHRKNLFQKLGTRNAAMTVMRAIQFQLIQTVAAL